MRKLFLALALTGALAACETLPEIVPARDPADGPFRARTDTRPPTIVGFEAADRVFFAFDSSTLDVSSQAVLDRQVAWMRDHPAARFMLAGHGDERGTREYNIALGQRRAAAVQDYLVARGIAADRIRLISYGKERPAEQGSSETVWAMNRRVETLRDE